MNANSLIIKSKISCVPSSMTVLDMIQQFDEKKMAILKAFQRRLVWTPHEKNAFLASVSQGMCASGVVVADIDTGIEACQRIGDVEGEKEYQKLHYEIYKVRFIPDRRDWQQMIKLITYQDKQTDLLTKVKSILRGKKNASKPPLFPISYINAALEPKGTTPQDIVKDLAKALKPRRRYKFD